MEDKEHKKSERLVWVDWAKTILIALVCVGQLCH